MMDFSALRNPHKAIVRGLPAPRECPDGTIYGNYSLRLPNGWRVIDKNRIVDYDDIVDTQTAFTRVYLRTLPRRRSRQEQRDMLKVTRPPQYCKPGKSNVETFYVDIRSAYPSVYQRLSWDVEYLRGKYFSNNGTKIEYPFPLDWKTGRSYIVTGSLPGTRRTVHNGSIRQTPCYNPSENPQLVCAVWDVLSAIARYAVDIYGARYYNLDGAVITEKAVDPYTAFLDDLGLDYRVKHKGKADIHNLGSWQIGDRETKRYAVDSPAHTVDGIPLDLDMAEWVLDRFVRMH